MKTERLGKYLSFLLRHKPDHIGLTLSEDGGWLNIEELICGVNKKENFKIDRDLILLAIREDEKGRFQLSENGENIRCVQGHSKGLTKVEMNKDIPPAILLHGTNYDNKDSILKEGLKARSREHVHLIESKDIAIQNAERWKGNKICLFYIDTEKMLQDGIVFYKSENNVWLTEKVEAEYIKEVKVFNNKNTFKAKGTMRLK